MQRIASGGDSIVQATPAGSGSVGQVDPPVRRRLEHGNDVVGRDLAGVHHRPFDGERLTGWHVPGDGDELREDLGRGCVDIEGHDRSVVRRHGIGATGDGCGGDDRCRARRQAHVVEDERFGRVEDAEAEDRRARECRRRDGAVLVGDVLASVHELGEEVERAGDDRGTAGDSAGDRRVAGRSRAVVVEVVEDAIRRS